MSSLHQKYIHSIPTGTKMLIQFQHQLWSLKSIVNHLNPDMGETGDTFILRQNSSLAVNLWNLVKLMCFQNILVRQNRIVILISKGRNLKEEMTGPMQAQNLAYQIPLDVSRITLFGSVHCLPGPLRRQCTPMALWGSHAPRHWAMTLLLRHWVVASWFPSSNQEEPTFWNQCCLLGVW